MTARSLPLLACLLIGLPSQGTGQPAIIYVKQDATGIQDGSSWADAYLNLQPALDAATAGDEVWVASGTYRPGNADANPDSAWYYIDKAISLYGSFAGTETSIDQRNIEANPTILNGDLMQDDVPGDFDNNRTDNCQHVVVVDSAAQGQVSIDGFIIQNGHADVDVLIDPDFFPFSGGAIIAYGKIALKNCTFLQNYASYGGAVECLISNSGSILIERCTFQGNRAWDWGGALSIQGNSIQGQILDCNFIENTCGRFGGAFLTASRQSIRVSSCTFANNRAGNTPSEGWGGASSSFDTGQVYFDGCTFTGNTASSDGAIDFQYGTQGFIDSCTFTQNTGEFGGAAGGYSWLESSDDPVTTIVVTNSAFHQNTATISGGALLLAWQASGVVENCVFTENVAEYAGGIGFAGNPDFGVYPGLSVNACYFEHNSGGVEGGGIDVKSGKDIVISNSLFFDNSGPGSGLFQSGTFAEPSNILSLNNTLVHNVEGIHQQGKASITLQNTILYNPGGTNVATSGSNSQEWFSQGGNLSHDHVLADYFTAHPTDLYDADPLFVSDTDLHLTKGSPCIDAGVSDGIESAFDLEGNIRLQGNSIDIGAYESPFTTAYHDRETLPGNVTCYPIPCSDELHIRFENDWTGQLELLLFQAEGKVLKIQFLEKQEQQMEYTMPVSDLAPGIYWICLVKGQQQYILSFSKH